MTKTIKKLSVFLVMASILIAGIFCYQGIQSMDSHCSDGVNSAWCNDFFVHGTIVSEAILTIIFTISVVIISLIFIKPFWSSIIKKIYLRSEISNHRLREKIFTPIQLAISNGIIHPRIP